MYFSIENRSPFLDRELFELSCRLPTRFLIRDGFSKVVLRDAMRGIVPDAVLNNRRKVGFNAPVTSFLKINQPDVRDYLLAPSPIFNYVQRDKIAELIGAKNGTSGRSATGSRAELPNSQSKFLFYFLNAKVFLEEFGSRDDA
jgi:asparagine synthase (glutamine-hydrolysing)